MRRHIFGAVLSGLLLATSQSTRADAIFSTGFEPPTYTTGNVVGQDGWFNAPPGFANVVTSPTFAGTQALTLNASAVGGQTILAHAASYNSVGNSQSQVTISGEFFLGTTGTAPLWNVTTAFNSGSGFIGALLVETGGYVDLGLAGSSVGHVNVNTGTWNSFQYVLDYATQTQSAFVNGTFVGSGAFATNATDLGLIATGVDAGTGTSTLTLDNLAVTSSGPASSGSGAVPLPASMYTILLTLGALALTPKFRALTRAV